MLNRKMSLGAMSFVVLLELLLPLVSVASASNTLDVTPAVINLGGQVTITLTTEEAAVGTLTVTHKPTMTSWTINIAQLAGSTAYVFPTAWPAGANTNAVGDYDVQASVTIGNHTPIPWAASFRVEFFVVPELPLGILMATLASFAALGILKKYKTRQ